MRARLCEVLSSLANCEVTEDTFVISAPSVEEGQKTSVMVKPRNRTRRYGFRKITYLRFDLSTLKPIDIPWAGELSTKDLAKRPELGVLFTYRIPVRGKPGVSTPRSLTLRPEDVVDVPINAGTALTVVTLRAHDESDHFIGEWRVSLTRI